MVMYFMSLFLSVINLIMTIFMTFAEEESDLWKVYGEKENYILLGVSVIFFILGFIIDTIKRKEW